MLEGVLLASLVYGGYQLAKYVSSCLRQPSQPDPTNQVREQLRRRLAEQRACRIRAAQRIRQANHNMQLALLQMRQCPDFRRPASIVASAQCVPLAFRQRQFRRFRPQLIDHFAARLEEGVPVDSLMPSLVQLVTKLGIAAFEADYIRVEAVARLQDRETPAPRYADRMRQLQSAHQERVSMLQNMPELDEELREQLIELEEQRLRESLVAAADHNDDGQA